MIFCDHANVFHNLGDIRIDYKKLKDILRNDDHLVGALLYDGLPKSISSGKWRFLNYLKATGWVLQTNPIKIQSDGSTAQYNVDENLYADVVELASDDAFDKAIIISGDKDFLEAMKELKKLEKEIEVWGFKRSISKDIINEMGYKNINYLDDILGIIKYHKLRSNWKTTVNYLKYKSLSYFKKFFDIIKRNRKGPANQAEMLANKG
jgi:uncharacterized LabA/DUF88 family protein